MAQGVKSLYNGNVVDTLEGRRGNGRYDANIGRKRSLKRKYTTAMGQREEKVPESRYRDNTLSTWRPEYYRRFHFDRAKRPIECSGKWLENDRWLTNQRGR